MSNQGEFFYIFSDEFFRGLSNKANFEKELHLKYRKLYNKRRRRDKIRGELFRGGGILHTLANNIDEKW